MRPAIIVLFVIYITSATAIKEYAVDFRFPIDARVIQGILDKRNLIHIFYEVNENNTVIDYFLRDMSRSCGSNKIEMAEGDVFQNFEMYPLNGDKVLLVSMAWNPTKIEIVNLSPCKRTEIALSTEGKLDEIKVTRYSDSFDIYFKDSSACKDKYCRKSFDFEGNAISTPFNEFRSGESISVVKPIGSQMRSNNYLAFEPTKDKTIVHLVESDKSKVLTEIKDMQFSEQVSTDNNFITLAYRLNFTNLNLMQFDLEGNLKFETLVKYNYYFRTARVVNAPNGEVYVVVSECDRDHCGDELNVYSVKKFDSNGTELGSLLLKLPLPGIIQDLTFYEDKESHCLTRAQLSLGVSGIWQFKKLDIVTKCFTDKDFA